MTQDSWSLIKLLWMAGKLTCKLLKWILEGIRMYLQPWILGKQSEIRQEVIMVAGNMETSKTNWPLFSPPKKRSTIKERWNMKRKLLFRLFSSSLNWPVSFVVTEIRLWKGENLQPVAALKIVVWCLTSWTALDYGSRLQQAALWIPCLITSKGC